VFTSFETFQGLRRRGGLSERGLVTTLQDAARTTLLP
jgi:hypothetical protein